MVSCDVCAWSGKVDSKGSCPFCRSCCEGHHLLIMLLEMVGKLCTCAIRHVRRFLATAYSGRAIRDAARSASQRRSPPGAGMEEADASASRGIFNFIVLLGHLLPSYSSWCFVCFDCGDSTKNVRKISGPDPMAAAVGEGRQFGCL